VVLPVAVTAVGASAIVTVVPTVAAPIVLRLAASFGVGVSVGAVIALGTLRWAAVATVVTASTALVVLLLGVVSVTLAV